MRTEKWFLLQRNKLTTAIEIKRLQEHWQANIKVTPVTESMRREDDRVISRELGWVQKSKYHIESQSGYRVCRVHGRDRVTWEAWSPGRDPASARSMDQYNSGEGLRELIGIFESGPEARRECFDHESIYRTRMG